MVGRNFPAVAASDVKPKTSDTGSEAASAAQIATLNQFWENALHVKNERMSFTCIYATIVATTLAFLHSNNGDTLLGLSVLGFVVMLSVMGLLISIRLKAELEDWLRRIAMMAEQMAVAKFLVEDQLGGVLTRHLKFRWLFPVFYGLTTAASLALLIHRVQVALR